MPRRSIFSIICAEAKRQLSSAPLRELLRKCIRIPVAADNAGDLEKIFAVLQRAFFGCHCGLKTECRCNLWCLGCIVSVWVREVANRPREQFFECRLTFTQLVHLLFA